MRSADPIACLMEKFFQNIHVRKTDYIKKWKKAIHYALRDGSSMFMTTFSEKYGYQYSVITIDRVTVMPAIDADVQESNAVAITFNVSRDFLMDKRNGFIESGVDAIVNLNSTTVKANSEDERDGITTTQLDPIRKGQDDIADMQKFTITEVYMRDDKGEERIVTIHEETVTLLRDIPNPYEGKRKMVILKCYSNDSSIFGDCPASIGGYFAQMTLDVLLNSAMHQQMRQTNPRLAVPESTFRKMIDRMKKEESQEPGAMIPFEMDGGANSQLFKNIELGASGNALLDTFNTVGRESQGMFGVTDASRGQQMQGDATATEALQINEGGKRILSYVVGCIGEALSEQAMQEFEILTQFKDNEKMRELWDRIAFMPIENPPFDEENVPGLGDPMTEEEYPQPVQPEPIPFDVLFADTETFWLTANGKFSTSRMITAKRAVDRMQILATVPEVQADRGLSYEVIRDVLHSNGDKNPETFIGYKEDWLRRQIAQEELMQKQVEMQLQMQQMQQVMQSAGMVPPDYQAPTAPMVDANGIPQQGDMQ
jgi:hypothetical protein